MSHILDALKKSELERSRGAAPEFSAMQMMITQARKKTPIWVYFLALLLVVNIIFVASSYWKVKPLSDSAAPPASKKVDTNLPDTKNVGVSGLASPNNTNDYQRHPPNYNDIPAVDAGLTESQLDMTLQHRKTPHESVDTHAPFEVHDQDAFVRIDPRPKSTEAQASVLANPEMNNSQKPVPGPRPQNIAADTNDAATVATDSVAKNDYATPVKAESEPKTESEPKVRDETAGIPFLYDMDRAFQQTVPSLVFNSHIYSSDPNRRRIMINDQYLKKGQTVNGLTVEDITQEGVVLSKNNTSFRLSVIRNWTFGK